MKILIFILLLTSCNEYSAEYEKNYEIICRNEATYRCWDNKSFCELEGGRCIDKIEMNKKEKCENIYIPSTGDYKVCFNSKVNISKK